MMQRLLSRAFRVDPLLRYASIEGAPVVLADRGPTSSKLSPMNSASLPQPQEKMLQGQAREFISRMQAEASALHNRAIPTFSPTCKNRAETHAMRSSLASGRELPALEKIIAFHA